MSAEASIIGLYERHAASFDRERGRTLQERGWLDRFLALVPPGGCVLDVGCGMGEPIARYVRSSSCVARVSRPPSGTWPTCVHSR